MKDLKSCFFFWITFNHRFLSKSVHVRYILHFDGAMIKKLIYSMLDYNYIRLALNQISRLSSEFRISKLKDVLGS